MNVLLYLFIGLTAGSIVAKRPRASLSLPAAAGIGSLGALAGGFLFGGLGLAARGLFGSLIAAPIGALILLLLVGLFSRSS